MDNPGFKKSDIFQNKYGIWRYKAENNIVDM